MALFAIVTDKTGQSGRVKNIAVGDVSLGPDWIDITNLAVKPSKGWLWNGTFFSNSKFPGIPVPGSGVEYFNPKIKSTKFYQRFLKKDRTSIENSNSDVVNFFWADVNYDRYVLLTDATFRIRFNDVADVLNMTAPERTAVLRDGTEDEVYHD